MEAENSMREAVFLFKDIKGVGHPLVAGKRVFRPKTVLLSFLLSFVLILKLI